MSKFIEAIKAEITYPKKYKAILPSIPLLTVEEKINTSFFDLRVLEYFIGVHYGVKISCEEKVLEEAKKTVIRSLVSDLYGDLLDKLRDLELAIYERDLTKAHEALHILRAEILRGE